MTQEEFLHKYEASVKAEAQAKAARKVLEMRLKLGIVSEKTRTETAPPAPNGYDDDEAEQLQGRLMTARQAMEFLSLNKSKLNREINKGRLVCEQPNGPNTKRWITTQSVLDYDPEKR